MWRRIGAAPLGFSGGEYEISRKAVRKSRDTEASGW